MPFRLHHDPLQWDCFPDEGIDVSRTGSIPVFPVAPQIFEDTKSMPP